MLIYFLVALVCASAFPINRSQELYFSQNVDHFSWTGGQYQQRYFLFDEW